jgi:hypothetical protein
LNAADARFADFTVWRDANQDGVSQAGELFSLAKLGIASITLAGDRQVVDSKATGNIVYATSEFTRPNGTTGDVGDVFLAYSSSADASEARQPSTAHGRSVPLQTRLADEMQQPQQSNEAHNRVSASLPDTEDGQADRFSGLPASGEAEVWAPAASHIAAPRAFAPMMPLGEWQEGSLDRRQTSAGPRPRAKAAMVETVVQGSGNAQLEKLIAAMASFQAGDSAFGASLSSRPVGEAVIAQLAPAI